jgi:spermidine synthase
MTKRTNNIIQSAFEKLLPARQDRPFVFEDDREISLHFDIRAVQSTMYKDSPFDLVFSYTRAMMGFLLFQPAPRDILIVGLGGGSLSKYCYRHLPEARITTVEINENIIALRDTFAIPPDDERFLIVHADGAEYIADQYHSADVILLDGYNADGLPHELSNQYFYNQCASALRDQGVLVANLHAADRQARACIARLRKSFDKKVLKAKSDSGYNQIVYAVKCDQMPDWETLLNYALELELMHGIHFLAMLGKMEASVQ